MPRPNPSHPEDWLDEEIDSLLRSVETGEELEPPAPPASAAARASARWFRRPARQPEVPAPQALPPAHPRTRRRPRLWARARSFVAMHRGDLGFYAAGIVASAIVGWLIVVLHKP
jgi:hypothetical protein